jgi:hypothetical protein
MDMTNQTKLKLISPRVATLALAAAVLVATGCNPTPTPKSTPEPASKNPDSPVSITPTPGEAAEKHPWTTQQILTCTVSQCWQLSGKNEEEFFDIVQDLAAISAKNRNLTLPEDEAAGKKAGEIIKDKAKADHNQLLFAVVDEAVRQVGTETPEATK